MVWVGTGENTAQRSVGFGDGVYKSEDAGETWRRVGLEQSEHIGRILIDPRNSNVVFVVALMRKDRRRAEAALADAPLHRALTRRNSDRAPAHHSARSVIYNGFK